MQPIPIERHTLPNGLRLVHSYDKSTAMVAVDILYDTGARDESRTLTGMAHLFEHLMFGGSEHVPDFDLELENAGGKSNAWTSNDLTNFYETLPAQNLDTALHLESDRMLSPLLSEHSLSVQRTVVIEEFKQTCLDRPYGDLSHHLRRLAYAAEHPYSWPTIGLEPGHIARVTVEDAQRWFYSHYAPNNAILAIAGNVDFDTACRRAEEWFADVPSREIAQRRQPDPGFPAQAVTETVRGDVPYPLITIGIPMAEYGRPEYFAADTITDILSVGRSGRLRNNLVNGPARGLIAEADASIIGSEGPGLLLLTFSVLSDTDADIERAIELTWREVRRMGRPGDVSDRELQRTLNNFESTFRFSNINYLSKATNLAQAELHGEDLNRTVSDRRALTPADIERESRRLFEDTPPVTLIYRPR